MINLSKKIRIVNACWNLKKFKFFLLNYKKSPKSMIQTIINFVPKLLLHILGIFEFSLKFQLENLWWVKCIYLTKTPLFFFESIYIEEKYCF